MKYLPLIIKSLLFHWRLNLAVLLGSALCTGVVTGALVTGDSVRHSLSQITRSRLGKVEYALSLENRFFRKELDRILAVKLERQTASLLSVRGIAVSTEQQDQVKGIRVLGVDKNFWSLARKDFTGYELTGNEAVINRELASALKVKVGDQLLVRVEKKEILPADTPLTLHDLYNLAFRVTIKHIAPPEKMGNFSLANNQIIRANLFVSYNYLAGKTDLEGYGDTLLVGKSLDKNSPPPEPAALTGALREALTLEDLQLSLRYLPGTGEYELFSKRLFIEDQIKKALREALPDTRPVFSYLVNAIKAGNKSTPYSFIAAVDYSQSSPLEPAHDNNIIITDWLSGDLGIKKGDKVTIDYFTISSSNKLIETSAAFVVEKIVSLKTPGLDENLMPYIPGISDEVHCRDWETEIPIDLKKIRDKDEEFWNDYQGTPKALITYNAAKMLWKNRFGSSTAIRFKGEESALSAKILEALDPAWFGFSFRSVGDEGRQAGKGSVDFGQLFLSLSFFLIVSTLLLLMLLYRFSIESRERQTGLFLALGFPVSHINYILLTEGMCLAVTGGAAGIVLGIGYARAVIFTLSTIWIGAVHTESLFLFVSPLAVLSGGAAGVLLSFITMIFTVFKQVKVPVHKLQKGISTFIDEQKKRPYLSILLLTGLTLAALICVGAGFALEKYRTALFFISGTLLLIDVIMICDLLMLLLYKSGRGLSLFSIGIKNYQRSRAHLLTILALIAGSLFLTISVGINRQDLTKEAFARSSGTGGFAFYGESQIPLVRDLSDPEVRRDTGLDKKELEDVSFIRFMVKEGDDASCLNLNRVQDYRIAGVNPALLAGPGAFSFVKTISFSKENPWLLLEKEFADQAGRKQIPVIADQTVVSWSFYKKVGDTISIVGENGEIVDLIIAATLKASIFQGNLLISEQNFKKLFPSITGYRMFLIDLPGRPKSLQVRQKTGRSISGLFRDYGLELTGTIKRLAAFKTVENTYLSIFLALGALAIILGGAGMGIIIIRTSGERKNEMAILRTFGYSKGAIYRILLAEYTTLFLLAALGGIVAGLTAVMPSLLASGAGVPYTFLGITLLGVVLSGLLWILLAVIFSVPRKIAENLRDE